MSEFLSPSVIEAAQAHARAEYPKESCGLVVGGVYQPCFNYATAPEQDFEIASRVYKDALDTGALQAVLHSHPGGPFYPSERDMQSQIDMDLPWGIIVTDGERTSPPIVWGDSLPIAPVIGREFTHGIHDCYSLVRDTFRLGKERLSEQGIEDWPFDPIELPEVARSDGWWSGDQDLYADHFAKFGFTPVPLSEVRPGDCFLMGIRSEKLNHAGILLSNDLLLHHLPTRLSRREPVGIWARHAEIWVRYEGQNA
ncbi:Proteasome lid subunit RPN8/RPN11, contains Jab1/MPN metalloenzyme (JAMM) motif [Faunimonas pinastri]|uniref:Proteasome lid subunit RPN8/RPN11, contains Jab1/MPN metalloenzyme (JAMM) motif n=1 Tax=Faunimonas pinastri TaxID=1855383 RepID=A0A1H9N298_9HYPH|nr:C40 family peptidase [Faunimonas pinastri]SER29897.1 Proteasome lid subunit RPN8/RPN11, contains Jab1/MPN metalloenzyme (JAMM) motif [Faunimonas pinastri]